MRRRPALVATALPLVQSARVGSGRVSYSTWRLDARRRRRAFDVYYLEHHLRLSGIAALRTVVILRSRGAERICRDLEAELLDLFPDASIREVEDAAAVAACDLLIVLLPDRYAFPLQDVGYAALPYLRRLVPAARAVGHVMLYRAHWREAEVLRGPRLGRRLRRRRLESAIISMVDRSPFLRQLVAGRESR